MNIMRQFLLADSNRWAVAEREEQRVIGDSVERISLENGGVAIVDAEQPGNDRATIQCQNPVNAYE